MLGKDLKRIRKKLKLTQVKFAKRLGINISYISKMENNIIDIPPKIEKALERNIKKEYNIELTNKMFSRELFLLNMLTGNELIDDLYINAEWLMQLDGKKVSLKKTRITVENDKKEEIGFLGEIKEYIIEGNANFYVKRAWVK